MKNLNRLLFILLTVSSLYSLSGCEPENEILLTDRSARLNFSSDTVTFDTVLSRFKTFSRRLTVYNPQDQALKIDLVNMTGGDRSYFTILADGQEGKFGAGLQLNGRDSLLIVVSAKILEGAADLPFLLTDSLIFHFNGRRQGVLLMAWGQDAHFLDGVKITKNTVWSGTKPYVITNSIILDSLAELTIAAGTEVRMSYESGFYVKGKLKIEGTADKPVIFTGIRQDGDYKTAFGQWDGIYILQNSPQAEVNYAQIRNGTNGFRVGKPDNDTIPDLIVKNTLIENMASYGIVGFSSDIYGENLLITNCIRQNLALAIGGWYRFRHCTFAAPGGRFFRETPSALFSNFAVLGTETKAGSFFAEIENSVLWGNLEEETEIGNLPGVSMELNFRNCLIRSLLKRPASENNLINLDPKFKDPLDGDFHPDSLSPLRNAGLPLGITHDLAGKKRDEKPDIGALEAKE